MPKTLVPVDGSAAALRAVDYAARLAAGCQAMEIFLINVQPPTDSLELKRFMTTAEIEAMQEVRGGDALAAARQRLEAAGVAYTPEVLLGPVAETIVAYAREKGCDQIVMGNKGESFLAEVITGSVAHDVLRLATMPVMFVK
jgi:nucleotide-binding universal stress UspA family protein